MEVCSYVIVVTKAVSALPNVFRWPLSPRLWPTSCPDTDGNKTLAELLQPLDFFCISHLGLRLELANEFCHTHLGRSMAAKICTTRTRSCASLTSVVAPAHAGHSTCRPRRASQATCNPLHRFPSFSRKIVSLAATEGSRDPSPSSIPPVVDSGNRSHVTDFVVIGSGIGGGSHACC